MFVYLQRSNTFNSILPIQQMKRIMLWTFRHLPVLLFLSTIEYGNAIDQCRTEVNIQGMALKRSVFKRWSVAAPHLCDMKCGQETTCQSYNYNSTTPRRQDRKISSQHLHGFTSGDWTTEVSRDKSTMYLPHSDSYQQYFLSLTNPVSSWIINAHLLLLSLVVYSASNWR